MLLDTYVHRAEYSADWSFNSASKELCYLLDPRSSPAVAASGIPCQRLTDSAGTTLRSRFLSFLFHLSHASGAVYKVARKMREWHVSLCNVSFEKQRKKQWESWLIVPIAFQSINPENSWRSSCSSTLLLIVSIRNWLFADISDTVPQSNFTGCLHYWYCVVFQFEAHFSMSAIFSTLRYEAYFPPKSVDILLSKLSHLRTSLMPSHFSLKCNFSWTFCAVEYIFILSGVQDAIILMPFLPSFLLVCDLWKRWSQAH